MKKRTESQPEPTPAPAINGSKALANPFLPENLQGADYKVVGFKLQPIISVRNKGGKEIGLFDSNVAVRVFEGDFYKPMPQIAKKAGLAMESRKR